MSERPQARSDRLVIEAVGEELLVYDQSTQTAHSLSVAVRKVWERCDGQHTPSQLAGGLKLTPTIVEHMSKACGKTLTADQAQEVSREFQRFMASLVDASQKRLDPLRKFCDSVGQVSDSTPPPSSVRDRSSTVMPARSATSC